MDEMMSVDASVSVQIQRAFNDAINSQVLRQTQNAIMAESGHVTQKGWNVPAERPEINTEVLRNKKARNNSKSELVQNVSITNPRIMLTTMKLPSIQFSAKILLGYAKK